MVQSSSKELTQSYSQGSNRHLLLHFKPFIFKIQWCASGGSRISHWGPLTRWGGGGADPQRVLFLAKTDVKTKEMDPVGGGGARTGGAPLDPPMCTVQW